MSERDFNTMQDAEFEKILLSGLPDVPPDDVSRVVTPWKHAILKCLIGLSLTSITLDFFNLQYILPAIGLVLMLLGFRALRKTNGYFKACFCITAVKTVIYFASLVINATFFNTTFSSSAVYGIVSVISTVMGFIMILCLRSAIRAVQSDAGLKPHTKGAVAMAVWYIVICLLLFVRNVGIITALLILVSYLFIISSLYKLSNEIDQAGYVIQATASKLSNRTLVLIISALLVVNLTFAYIFLNNYPMNWSEVSADEHADVRETKEYLISLGFPEDILNDITAEDILACKGADYVTVKTNDHPVNNGIKITEYDSEEKTCRYSTKYNEKELRITGVGVRIPGELETWRYFHHFKWISEVNFYGTEAINIEECSKGCLRSSEYTGRVLYDRDGKTMKSPYYRIGNEEYVSGFYSTFGIGNSKSSNCFALFSMPQDGTGHRGYVTYSTEKISNDFIILPSYVNYIHQKTWIQYPVITAADHWKTGLGFNDRTFFAVQDSLYIYLDEVE